MSDFVRGRFFQGVEGEAGKAQVVLNGVRRDLASPPVKERTVLFVGRLIEDKGPDHLVEALAAVLPRHPDWQALIVGAPRPGAVQALTPFESKLRARAAALGDAVRFQGFLPHDEVQDHSRRAAIVVVPSTWQEPFGRTAVEGLAAGCAVIAYDRGGLGEILRGRGLLLEECSPGALAAALERVIVDQELREDLQRRAWSDFPFGIEDTTARHDDLREALLDRLAGNHGLEASARGVVGVRLRGRGSAR